DLLSSDKHIAEEQITIAQLRLFEAREAIEDLNHRATDARAGHATLVERASSIGVEVERLEAAAADLEQRCLALAAELAESRRKVDELQDAIAAGDARYLVDVHHLDE